MNPEKKIETNLAGAAASEDPDARSLYGCFSTP
jgi:hypothetical protein